MEHVVKRSSVWSVSIMFLAGVTVVGATLLHPPAGSATGHHCRLPQDVAVDLMIAQSGKASMAMGTSVIAPPVFAPRKEIHRTSETMNMPTVSYNRCAKNSG